jgi:enterochelin esterase-like enzyme
VTNIKKAYFIHPFSFNKVVSESGSVDQERPAMAKKKKKKKKRKKRDVEEKKMVSLNIYFKES